MELRTWSKNDFSVNAMFWKYWGVEASLPFRVTNLVAIQSAFHFSGVESSLFGRTLLDTVSSGQLGPDHDDDLVVSEPLSQALASVGPSLSALGFHMVRRTEEIVSLERWGRYVDIHYYGDLSTNYRRVHGADLSVALNAADLVELNDSRKPKRESPGRRVARLAGQSFSNPRLTVRQSSQLLRSTGRSLRKNSHRKERIVQLDEQEFRSLKLDSDNSINWNWRGQHLLAVTRPGMTIGDTVEHLSDSKWLKGLIQPELTHPLDEPIQLSPKFWESGNMFFAAPILYGFRHLVMPYRGANLYINRGISPSLFSSQYFESLAQMTDKEIGLFLSSHPLEVTNDYLTSGRHRASAMLGRLLRGESYIPVSVLARTE